MTRRAIAVIPDGSASAPVRDRLRSIQEYCESNDVDIIDIYVSELEKEPLEHIFRLAIGSVVMDDVDTIVFAHSRDLYGTGIDLYDLWDACSSAKVRIVFAEEPNFDLDAIVDKLVDRLGESIRRRFNGHVRAMGDYCYYVPPEDLEGDVPATPREDEYDAEDSEIFCDGWMHASAVEEESEDEPEEEPEIDDDVTRIIRTWCISSRIMADTLAQVLERHGIDIDAYGQDGDPDE